MPTTQSIFSARRIAGAVGLALWLASLTQTVTRACGEGGEVYSGHTVLLLGPLGPLEMQFGWFANPLLLWTAGSLLFDRRTSLLTALAAFFGLVLALSSFTWTQQFFDNGAVDLCGRGAGFYLWIGCAAFLCLAALADWTLSPRIPRKA